MGEGANGRNGETAKRLKTGAKWGLGHQRRHRRAEFFALPACSSDQHIRCYSPFRPFAASPIRRFPVSLLYSVPPCCCFCFWRSTKVFSASGAASVTAHMIRPLASQP